MAISASGVRAGAAYVELFIRDNRLIRGLERAAARLKAFGASVAALGRNMLLMDVGTAVAFGATAKVFADMGSKLLDISQRTGLSVEALSQLDYAAKQTGASMEALEAAVRRMGRTIGDAANGEKESVDALKAFGMTAEELMDMHPDQQFQKLAERLIAIEDPALRTAAAMDVFGRGGTVLIPMMMQLNGLMKDANRLGLVWTQEEAEQADIVGDRLTDVIEVFKRLIATIGGAVGPAFRDLGEFLTKALVPLRNWLDRNRELIAHILQVTALFIAFDIAVFLIGKTLWGVGVVLGVLVGAFKLVIASVVALIGVVTFLLSPLGLLVAAIGAVAVHAAASSETASGAFSSMADAATTAFQAIGDALKTGDFATAAEAAWLGLKIGWLELMVVLREAWGRFILFFENTWDKAVTGYMLLANEVKSAARQLVPFSDTGAIEENRQKQRRRLVGDEQRREADRMADLQTKLFEMIREIGPERRALAEVATRAAIARAIAEAGGPGALVAGGALAGVKALPPTIIGRVGQLDDLPDKIEKATKRAFGVGGGTDSAALARMGFGKEQVEQEQLKEQKIMRKDLDKIAAAAAVGGIAFWRR